ncbi:hypothetical protein [Nocardia kruczakiae]|uniref:hypothetical protein n=1 Tax=Nocardia kruczakiae TaxID=261477 RepID=UPI000A868206|nr:hypothetical protein [Nocardia kruczakiae]
MGTSTRWPGPTGDAWRKPNAAFGRLSTLSAEVASDTAPFDDKLHRVIEQCVSALRTTLEADPGAYGLIPTMVTSGHGLVDMLAELSSGGCPLPDSANISADRRTEFVAIFTERVVGIAATPADGAARAAAVRCARKLLEDKALADAVESGGHYRIPDDLFCAVYELFLKNVLIEFIAGVAAAKLSVAVPLLYLVDPGGRIAEWLADTLTELVLDPCAERADADDISLADLSRQLLEDNVRRLVGLPIEP